MSGNVGLDTRSSLESCTNSKRRVPSSGKETTKSQSHKGCGGRREQLVSLWLGGGLIRTHACRRFVFPQFIAWREMGYGRINVLRGYGRWKVALEDGADVLAGVCPRATVESAGMLCSAKELGINEEASGLYDLPANLKAGQALVSALELDDTIFEVNLTPNRGDAMSVQGVAREVAAARGTPLHPPVMAPVAATNMPGASGDERNVPRRAAEMVDDRAGEQVRGDGRTGRHVGRVLEIIAQRDGQPGPRELDAALDRDPGSDVDRDGADRAQARLERWIGREQLERGVPGAGVAGEHGRARRQALAGRPEAAAAHLDRARADEGQRS